METSAEPSWVSLRDEEMLALRICDLGVRLEGSELEPRVNQLFDDLASRGVTLRPDCYLGDEWFSPEGVPAIAIPFFRVDYTSLPLTVGILAGLMWVPLSWIIQHWVGIFHAVARTVLVTAAWYLAPHHRFVVIPAVIVGVYGVTIVILEQRWRAVSRSTAVAATA